VKLSLISKLAFLVVMSGSSIQSHAQTSGSSAPVPLSLGYTASSPSATVTIAQDTDAFKKEGIDLRAVNLTEAGTIIQSVLSGQIELGSTPAPAVLQAIANGAKLKILSAVDYAFTASSGKLWQAVVLVAPVSKNIRSIADLKGKKTAVVTIASTSYVGFVSRLKENNLVPAKDLTVLSMPFTQMGPALVSGEIDSAIITVTEYVRLQERLPMVMIMTGTELTKMPMDATQVLVARDDWLAANEALAVKSMRALLATRMFMQDDVRTTGGERLKESIKRKLGLPDALATAYYDFRMSYAGNEPPGLNPLEFPASTFTGYCDLLTEGNLLRGKTPPSYEQAVNPQYLKRAAKELGLSWTDQKAN